MFDGILEYNKQCLRSSIHSSIVNERRNCIHSTVVNQNKDERTNGVCKSARLYNLVSLSKKKKKTDKNLKHDISKNNIYF